MYQALRTDKRRNLAIMPAVADLKSFVAKLNKAADPSKMQKASTMLKADRFQLFSEITPEHVVGVVKSQTDADLVYSCRLASGGSYACCTQNLNVCGGLRGSLCKHLLVLLVGLVQGGDLDAQTAERWVVSAQKKKPVLDKDVMSEIFIRYKGAQAGEIDWRPTETIPEDYYAL
jgi:hypothetical protein